MAHAGEEGTFRAVGALGLLARLLGEFGDAGEFAGAFGDFLFERAIGFLELGITVAEVGGHFRERLRQHADFILRTHFEALGRGEIAGRQQPRGLGDALERLGNPPGQQGDDEQAQQHRRARGEHAAGNDGLHLHVHFLARVGDFAPQIGERIAEAQHAPALRRTLVAEKDWRDDFERFGAVLRHLVGNHAGLRGGETVVRPGVGFQLAIEMNQTPVGARVDEGLRVGVEDDSVGELGIEARGVGDGFGNTREGQARDVVADFPGELRRRALAPGHEHIAQQGHAAVGFTLDEAAAGGDFDGGVDREEHDDQADHRDQQLPANAVFDLGRRFHAAR